MRNALSVAVDAVTSYLIFLAAGWLIVRARLAREGFLQELNQFVFVTLYPITMFYNTHAISVSFAESRLLIGVCFALLVSVIAIWVAVVPKVERDDARRCVIIQCLNRSNIVLYAIGMAETLFGAEGVALASVVVAIFVPVYNVAAIVVLEYYRGGSNSVPALARKVVTNPLFLGAMVGLAFSLVGMRLPQAVESTVSKLSALTTPLAMIVLGGTIHVSGVMRDMRTIAWVLVAKMLLIPAVAVAACAVAGLPQLETFVCFIMFGTPVSANAYTMSQNMGGDGELAGELVAISTVASVVTLFVWIFALRSLWLV